MQESGVGGIGGGDGVGGGGVLGLSNLSVSGAPH